MELLSLICGEKILPEESLIIFDEIQECPEALSTLKYFNESVSGEISIVAALGVYGDGIIKVILVC